MTYVNFIYFKSIASWNSFVSWALVTQISWNHERNAESINVVAYPVWMSLYEKVQWVQNVTRLQSSMAWRQFPNLLRLMENLFRTRRSRTWYSMHKCSSPLVRLASDAELGSTFTISLSLYPMQAMLASKWRNFKCFCTSCIFIGTHLKFKVGSKSIYCAVLTLQSLIVLSCPIVGKVLVEGRINGSESAVSLTRKKKGFWGLDLH